MSRLRVFSLALAMIGCAGCGVRAQSSPERIPHEDVPFGLLDPESPPTSAPDAGDGAAVRICLVADGRLTVAERDIDERGDGRLVAALRELADSGDLHTAVREGTVVTASSEPGDTVMVELAAGFGELDPSQQVIAIGQIVCTATMAGDVDAVSFSLEGRPIDVPVDDGTLVSRPVRMSDYSALSAGVTLAGPGS